MSSALHSGQREMFSFFFIQLGSNVDYLYVLCAALLRDTAHSAGHGGTLQPCVNPKREAGRCERQPCVIAALIALSHLCLPLRRVRVLRLHRGRDLRVLPGRLLRQRFDWHSCRLSALPLPGPNQLCSNCGDGTGGVHQLPERTDR